MDCSFFSEATLEVFENFGRLLKEKIIEILTRFAANVRTKFFESIDYVKNKSIQFKEFVRLTIVDIRITVGIWMRGPTRLYWTIIRIFRRLDDNCADKEKSLLHYFDGNHTYGTLSIATAHAHVPTQDKGQILSGPFGTFFGVFDGHNGNKTAIFVSDMIFGYVTKFASFERKVSREILADAIAEAEREYIKYIERVDPGRTTGMSTMGTCCSIGFIWRNTLYIANIGDSQAVIGRLSGRNNSKNIISDVLTANHSTRMEKVRQGYQTSFPRDKSVLVYDHSSWRVKGFIPVSRTIGDAYLKYSKHRVKDKRSKFYFPNDLTAPLLSSQPYTLSYDLDPADKFIIVASHGFWDQISIHKAVQIVHDSSSSSSSSSREGIAGRLVEEALKQAIRYTGIRYSELVKKKCRIRLRSYYDDMTVMVIFLDRLLDGPDHNALHQCVRSSNQCISTAFDPDHSDLFKMLNAIQLTEKTSVARFTVADFM